ncbi:hypothetical protein [Nonlabens arenilitoris]|uniref:hypothetical protein n=1 Tax=Nonlabens arenilitoris TaxID=1217969 RepID=UPI0026B3ACB5
MSIRKNQFLKDRGASDLKIRGIELSQFSETKLHQLWNKTLMDGIHGICFSIYEDGQKPGDKISLD